MDNHEPSVLLMENSRSMAATPQLGSLPCETSVTVVDFEIYFARSCLRVIRKISIQTSALNPSHAKASLLVMKAHNYESSGSGRAQE